MSFQALLVHDVVVTTPGTTGTADRYGNLILAEASVTEKMRLQPAGGVGAGGVSEDIIDRDTRITLFRVFAKKDTTVTGLSTLTWEGRTLRVKGEPRPFYGRSSLHHYEFDAEEVLG